MSDRLEDAADDLENAAEDFARKMHRTIPEVEEVARYKRQFDAAYDNYLRVLADYRGGDAA